MKKKKYIILPALLSLLLLSAGMLSGCTLHFDDYTGTYEAVNSSAVVSCSIMDGRGNLIAKDDFKLENIKIFIGKSSVMLKAVPVSQSRAQDILDMPLIQTTYRVMTIYGNGPNGISLSVKNIDSYSGYDQTASFQFERLENSMRLYFSPYLIFQKMIEGKGNAFISVFDDYTQNSYELNFKKTKSYDKLDEWNFFDNTGGNNSGNNNGGNTESALAPGNYLCYKIYNPASETDLSELLDSFGYRFAIKANNKFDLFMSVSGIELPYPLTGIYSVSDGRITFDFDDDEDAIFHKAEISGADFICADIESDFGNNYYFRKQ